MSHPALALTNVSKRFGGIQAVRGISFSVEAGSIFGLIGPNGAGKTTLFNLVTGLYKSDTGSILLDGIDLTGEAPAKIASLGVARTFQNIRLFSQLTVLENVLVACETTRKSGLFGALGRTAAFWEDEREMGARSLELLATFGLTDAAYRYPSSLSYGDQRRLEIARAMMLRPKLLLLDEPAAGMNYGEAEGLKGQVRWLRDEFGITIVLVEHNMQVVMGVCDAIHVLDQGGTIAHGPPDAVRRDPRVRAAYLGEELGEEPVRATGAEGSP